MPILIKDTRTHKNHAPNGHGHSVAVTMPLALNVVGRWSAFCGSLAITAIAVLYAIAPVPLPGSYALCTLDGNNIYTVNEANSRTQCLVVSDSYIVDTGSLGEVKERWNRPLTVQEANAVGDYPRPTLVIRYVKPGSIVVPGLSDSHCHILEYGASRQIPLEPAKSIKDAVAAVREYVLTDQEIFSDNTKFVEGWGWDHTSWPGQQWPTATDLDSDLVIRGRPVILEGKDGHAIWVSSKAMELSAPFPDTVDGGITVRNETGSPIGVFIDNAQDLIKKPPITEHDLIRRFNRTIRDAIASGLTSLHDAGFDPMSLKFFKRQAEKGNIPLRIYGMTYFDEHGEYWGDKTEHIIGAGNGKLTARSVKIFADGALRTGYAALHEPYHDNPQTNGVMRLSPEVMNKVIPRFLRDGWQVNVHAVGDRANTVVLDAFEAALKGVNVTALRPRLEHAQVLTKADMVRLGKLGVIASIQPTHAISDMLFAEDRLGPERVKGLYAFRSVIDNGARIAFGSDFPVEDLNPISGFYAAVTRLSPQGDSPHGPGGWFPEQRLTRMEALRGMTIDPAYASFTESTLGSLEPGKLADYVVLSQNIMTVEESKILDTKVIATVIDGKPVYGQI